MNTIRSHATSSEGCECGAPFPQRVYFTGFDIPLAQGVAAQCMFMLTCTCGRTYPLAVEGYGSPPLGGGTPRPPRQR